MRKVLTCEQNKEFHNAAALGLFNSAVGKGGEPFKDLSYFEKLANNYNSFEDFYSDVSKMNNISIEVSNDFRKKYKNNYNDTPKNALLNLFNAQKKPFENTPKGGKFQFENIGGIIYRRDNKTGIVSKQGKAPKLKLP